MSLLMKLNPRVTELALYDIKGGPGQTILEEPEKMVLIDKQASLLISAISTPRAS